MKASKPELVQTDSLHVLTVTSVGDPNKSEAYLRALYGTAYATKMKVYKPQGKTMTLGKLMARWPDAHLKPKDQWTGVWAIPVPDYVSPADLLQKDPALPVAVQVWQYNEVAQVLHIGPYDAEGPNIQLLHDFIANSGYEIAGDHEEIYLTSPQAKIQKTLIRYPVRKK